MVDETKVITNYKLDLKGLTKEEKDTAKERVGSYITSKIIKFLGNSSSPVQGAPFKVLKADKTVSRLFETGSLWSNIEHGQYRDGVQIGVFDPDDIPKGFNHNVGDTLPTRRFIPLKGEKFKPSIINGVNAIMKRIRSGDSGDDD